MDMLKNLLAQKGPEWIRLLTDRAGMDPAQAEKFLPLATQAVATVLQGGKLDLSSLLGGGGAGALLGQLDLGGLASSSGVDEAKARAGVETLGPELLGSLSDQAGGLDGLLGALGGGEGGAGDLLGSAGSLGKKLFG